MLPVLLNILRPYAPYAVWPAAAVIGFVGYNIERLIRGDEEMAFRKQSVGEERDARLLQESLEKDPLEIDRLKDKKFVPKTIFRTETSPRQS